MLAHCVQDATVVDVEKRRNPSKHYVSAARVEVDCLGLGWRGAGWRLPHPPRGDPSGGPR